MYLYLCAYACTHQILISFILILSHLHLSLRLIVLGLGWLRTSVAFEVAQSNTFPKGPVLTLFLPVMGQLDWAGVTLSPPRASQCYKVLGHTFLGAEEPASSADGPSCQGVLKPPQVRARRCLARTSWRWEQTWEHALIQARIQDHDPTEVLSRPRQQMWHKAPQITRNL